MKREWFYAAPWPVDQVRRRGKEVAEAYARINSATSSRVAWYAAMGYESGAFNDLRVTPSLCKSITAELIAAYDFGFTIGGQERYSGPALVRQLELI